MLNEIYTESRFFLGSLEILPIWKYNVNTTNCKGENTMTFRELISAAHISQVKLSTMLNIPLSTMNKWSADIAQPPAYLVNLIEYYLRNEGYITETENSNENT